jgi:hypothetical protein
MRVVGHGRTPQDGRCVLVGFDIDFSDSNPVHFSIFKTVPATGKCTFQRSDTFFYSIAKMYGYRNSMILWGKNESGKNGGIPWLHGNGKSFYKTVCCILYGVRLLCSRVNVVGNLRVP